MLLLLAMKTNTHPNYNSNIQISCNSCGIKFESGSTLDSIRIEICSNCHPFYTGKAKIVDTENLVKKFESRQSLVQSDVLKHKMNKKAARSTKTTSIKSGPALTLRDMLKQMS